MKFLALLLLFVSLPASGAYVWRPATERELKALIPARAPVVKERIETESRTASGVTDGKGKFIAGVVLITAGYSAEGKYSHFLLTQVALKMGDVSFKPGNYVFGWERGDDFLNVKFYEAESGKFVGAVEARRSSRTGKIESFRIYPPNERSVIQIGRFALSYQVE
jgi:hypothetical protein